MKVKFVTECKTFVDPTKEAIASTLFGILWANSEGESQIISRFGWSIKPMDMGTKQGLRDHRGETRIVSWGAYHPAIEFPDWASYDANKLTKELDRLQKENQRLTEARDNVINYSIEMANAVAIVYDINQAGGPWSRRKVKDLLSRFVTHCDKCGRADCACR